MKALFLTLFTELGLAEPVLRAVVAESYTTPTPIQAQAIPVVLAGADLIGIAQTGTGKTAAFVLPLLHKLAEQRQAPEARTCRALILAPTRELAQQIAESTRAYGKFIRPRVAVVIGGAKPGPQARQLLAGLDIVVATPGRLLDHIATGVFRLDATDTIVLDEADQMLDLGFMPAIRRIMAMLPARRQTMLFSATMPKPIRALATEFLRDPREVAVTPESRPIDRIDQQVMLLDANAKRTAVVTLLADRAVERAIVFTRTKHGADKLVKHLETSGLTAAAIHGNKSQSQRERALGMFRDGRIRILVATDIAARGIDVDGISHVVNYELPNVPESYVHRIGRTARAGASGVAVSFCEPAELAYLRDIERLIGRQLIPGGAVPPRGVAPPHLNRVNNARNHAQNHGNGHNPAHKQERGRQQHRPGASASHGNRSHGERAANRA
ncbi:DEAD/DEAH box helicase [Acidiphilium iwatense]|uniref:DEAD/DEAH box helicase n=1 Tax=Acidiphilium iwatense TaxID=768198 RepID=A0ABS9DQT3_9PROT|nr:DEAD/DEAH box helicase [Acidiphilium iwatense]MCF3945106.1 DEAD/DEAH box helicase [Acidiphilium iwatense]